MSLTLLHCLCFSSEGWKIEAASSWWMSIQNLQADGALLRARPQRAALLHWNRASAGRGALKQQSLSWPGPTRPLSLPKIKTTLLDYESQSFQGRGQRRKEQFRICISSGGCVDKAMLLYQQKHLCWCVWPLERSARNLPYYQRGWFPPPTPTVESISVIQLWPCLHATATLELNDLSASGLLKLNHTYSYSVGGDRSQFPQWSADF